MLTSLTIKNIVLIDLLTITFRQGLCTLTGETGAGKSILLDALGLAIGSRAEARLVRKNQEQASVTASFEPPDTHPVFAFLREQDMMIEDQILILRRTLKSDGRSKAFLNDQPISISLLSQIGNMLIEIHGQHETQGLLDPATHRLHLDQFAQIGAELKSLKQLWEVWQTAEETYERKLKESEQARAEEEFLRQSIEDLDKLSPQEDEEETLSELRLRLMNRESILEGLNNAYQALNGESDPVRIAARELDRISDKAGDDLNPAIEALDRASSEIQEAISQIQNMSDTLSESDYNLQEIDDRLFALKAQAHKHACQISDLPKKRDELAAALNLIEASDDILSTLLKQVNIAKKDYIALAKKLSEIRHSTASKLDQEVAKELPPLKMERAKFVTSIETLGEENWHEAGMDKVRFLVATNPGSEPGPLGKIASGGEMSRFMLALKVVMAEVGTVETMIFDEVDAGIGGATADAVGERLARLGHTRQILVVTHSPQVAARGSYHWIVQKNGNDQDVTTSILSLETSNDRREEVARMLSGAEITGEARRAAAKLLEGKAA